MLVNAVIYFLVYMLGLHLWQGFRRRGEVFLLLRGMKLRHLGWGVAALLTTAASAVAMGLLAVRHPALQWSWLMQLAGDAATPVAVGQSKAATVPGFVVAGMYAMLVLAMPMLVLAEEKMFRRGADVRHWGVNLALAVAFGLSHAIVGVPLFAAIALVPMGLWLNFHYRRAMPAEQAVLETSRIHLANNLLALGLFFVAVAIRT